VADVVRSIRRGRIDDLNPVFGEPPADLIERGRWQMVILDTTGDPTVPSTAVRTWELGLVGRDAMRNVPLLAGTANPYAGVQHVLTYAQVPLEGGGSEGRLGRTDFGSERLGPDGQTPFFNTRPDFAAFAFEDGVAFLFPEELDPVGFRAWSHGGGSDAWDLVQGPGGPMALIPADGSWPGLFDVVQPSVIHAPITQPAMIDGEAQPAHLFDSQVRVVFGSPLLDPGRPATIDLGYTVEDTTVRFEDLVAEPLGGGLFGTSFGIPPHGHVEFEEWVIEQFGELPDGWDPLSEATRAFGMAPVLVGDDEGTLHGPLVRPWMTGPTAAGKHPYDPTLLDLVVPPGPPPNIIRWLGPEGNVSEPTVDLIDVGIARGPTTGGMLRPLGFAIRTVAGPAPDDAYSNMVGVQCSDGTGAAGEPGNGFRIIREHHDGVERIITEGIPEASVSYRSTAWGHLFQAGSGVADLLQSCEAFTGFMATPDGTFLEDTSGVIHVGETSPLDDMVATLDRQVGGRAGAARRVVVTSDPAMDADRPTVDITDIAVARSDDAGGARVGVAIRAAGGPAPGTRNGSSVSLRCRVVSNAPGGSREFTIFHYAFDNGEDTFVDGYDRDLAAHGVTYESTPWGHLFTFLVKGSVGEDMVVYCRAQTGTYDDDGGWSSDRTEETMIEVTEPVEDILSEIEHAFVPA
jgi:hypothetical protein